MSLTAIHRCRRAWAFDLLWHDLLCTETEATFAIWKISRRLSQVQKQTSPSEASPHEESLCSVLKEQGQMRLLLSGVRKNPLEGRQGVSVYRMR